MRCQYCDEKKAVKEVEHTQGLSKAWMCEDCAKEFEEESEPKKERKR